MFDSREYRKAMEAVVERFNGEMSKVRTGRAHPDMLGGIKVEAYGQFMPLNQVANVTIADATMLLITPKGIFKILLLLHLHLIPILKF